MKIFSFIVVFFLLLAQNLSGQQQKESLLNTSVSIKQYNQPVSKILSEITQSAGVYFSYDADIIATSRKESIEAEKQTLWSILDQLFDQTEFDFLVKENQVIISLKSVDSTDTQVQEVDSSIINLTGRIIDAKRNEPLPYASVSIYNKPIGTISNTEGDYILKLDQDNSDESIIVSCMGYAQKIATVGQLLEDGNIALHPISIRIKEVRIKAITPHELLDNVLDNINKNYGSELLMMTSFYREVINQDEKVVSISEAVIDILKRPYKKESYSNSIKIHKGRKTPDYKAFKWVSFKLQGGPHSATMLDVLQTMDSFLDPEFRNIYDYKIDRVVWYNNYPAFVLKFKPLMNVPFPCYEGELFINRESYAIMHARYKLGKWTLRKSEDLLIKKKPHGFKVKPMEIEYVVDYKYNLNRWHFSFARASAEFRIKDKREKMNSVFHSTSELLVTNTQKSKVKKFPRNQLFSQRDIFVESINDYDEQFWGGFNIIKPEQNLKIALSKFKNINQDFFNHSEIDSTP